MTTNDPGHNERRTTRGLGVGMIAGSLLGLLLAAAIVYMIFGRGDAEAPADAGPAAVDIAPIETLAVYNDGRVKSFTSFANEVMGAVVGPKPPAGTSVERLYLELLIRPDQYADDDLIYVKQAQMRAAIVEVLRDDPAAADVGEERLARIMETGRISRRLLELPSVQIQLDRWSRDLIKTAKFVDRVRDAMAITDPSVGYLQRVLRIVPPATGGEQDRWLSIADLFPAPGEHVPPEVEALDPAKLTLLRASWADMVAGWRNGDVPRTEAAMERFSAEVRGVAPSVYPSEQRLAWESAYFKLHHMTWVWILYLLAVVFLLMAVAYKWTAARGLGLGVFGIALLLHTGAIGLRWWVSGRWPNSNMFEAVTTAVWFGAVLASLLEILGHRNPMRNLFALGAAAASGVAMMTAAYSDDLDANIRNMMPVLHDLWLYIHTNVIIASYALIFMAAVTAVLYIVRRVIWGDRGYARAGGAAMLIEEKVSAAAMPRTLGAVLDGATMVLIELSFILLWAGIIMGAIWADHSWGRPWGWDPKEVFALNTFLVYLVLVHVRLRSRDKGLWTAILSVIGCGVMLFNWIVINFVISGLHSYA